MDRRLASGLLALALAPSPLGCALDRAEMPERMNGGVPVGLDPGPNRPVAPPPVPRLQSPPAGAEAPPLNPPVPVAARLEPPRPLEPPTAEPPRDPAIQRTGYPAEDPEALAIEELGTPIGGIAARVGDTIITQRELLQAVKKRAKDIPDWSKKPRGEKEEIAAAALDFLIDRAVLIQAAHRELGAKDKKNLDRFRGYVEKMWAEDELPSLIRHEKVADEYELAKLYEKRGESLKEKREGYLLDTMAQQYAGLKLHEKLKKPGYNEVLAYYRKHLEIFSVPATVTWREIVLPIDAEHDEAAARALAARVLDRLRRGEDFAAVAKELSQGPKATSGGLWENTGYDSLKSDAIREALRRLSPGQLSGPIEERHAITIVKVESKREAGHKPLSEVQAAIETALWNQRFSEEMERLLAEYRKTTPISSPFFDTATR
jgi:hypothetical protein